MSPIPDFIDKYHLPPGEHECTLKEIEERFLVSEQRQKVWKEFNSLIDRMGSLGISPNKVVIDGSFVTGRENPGDVDFGALIVPSKIEAALKNISDHHDIDAIKILVNPQNQNLVRSLFGAHMLIAPNEFGLRQIAKIFKNGGEQFGQLRKPDPTRDPEWVEVPKEKGILKVNL